MTAADVTISSGPDSRSRLSSFGVLRPVSPIPTYAGVALTLVGFVLIAVTWGQIASLNDVAKQLPYVVSGGLTGLGLILVGMTVVSVAARRREAALRERQAELLGRSLDQLADALSHFAR